MATSSGVRADIRAQSSPAAARETCCHSDLLFLGTASLRLVEVEIGFDGQPENWDKIRQTIRIC
jgi:hypothetical protein